MSRLQPTTDCNGNPCMGVVVKDTMIIYPRESECGRFAVDPYEYYGLSSEEVEFLEEQQAQLDLIVPED